MSRFATITDVWDYLNNIPMFQNTGSSAANFSLDAIQKFCTKMGDPQNSFPSIHVAGTNGKGTTCYLLEQIYSDAGYRTGLFTSPHLMRYNERIRVGRNEIKDEELLEFFQAADKFLAEISLTYFEISTALAFWYFAQKQVEIAIIETGLGGRLDSTNIINPELSVITSIGLDHQAILGDTIEEIASEKSGIIKTGKPIVAGHIEGSALKVIKEKSKEQNASFYSAEALEPYWEEGKVRLRTDQTETELNTQFRESVNKWNVAIAWLVTDILSESFLVTDAQKMRSIEDFGGAPGRFEKIHPEFEWYFSGSHNMEALTHSLEAVEVMRTRSECVLVFSALKDKVNPAVMDLLKGFKKTYFVEQNGERAAKFEDINAQITAELLNEQRKEIILEELKTELVIFIGSFYFYPIVKRWTAYVS